MQCKDMEDAPLLAFIARKQDDLGGSVMSLGFEPPYSDLPDKLLRAKLGNLIGRGLADGCACGCSGNYKVTDKGIEFIVSGGAR
jgi:hypothetical protein